MNKQKEEETLHVIVQKLEKLVRFKFYFGMIYGMFIAFIISVLFCCLT